ncbi:MAG: AAA family ATPase, partial [Elusimicrobiota bacterium]|nr:AAA family ATPase [Elusimicrobiota bacterium]
PRPAGLPRAAAAAPRKAVGPAVPRAARPAARRLAFVAAAVGGAVALHALGLDASWAPLLLLIGGLDGGWTPTPAQTAEFLRRLRADAVNGGRVSWAFVHDAVEAMGLGEERGDALLQALLRDGHLVMRDNSTLLLYSFKTRLARPAGRDPDATAERAADASAQRAVELLNSGGPLEHLRAVAHAQKAVAAYAALTARGRAEPAQAEEARALRENAILESMGDLLRGHKAALEPRAGESAALWRRLEDANDALAWLGGAAREAGFPLSMPKAVHAKLKGLLDTLSPRDEAGRPVSDDDAVDGYLAILQYLEEHPVVAGPQTFARPLLSERGDPDDAAALGAQLFSRVEPGRRVTASVVKEAAEALDWAPARAGAAVTELARWGWVALLHNGAAILSDLPARAAPNGDDALRPAHQAAVEATRLLSSADARDHLLATARFEDAKTLYAAQRGSAEAARARELASALQADAFLEVAADALRASEKAALDGLAGKRDYVHQGPEELNRRVARAREGLAWLQTACFSVDRRFSVPHGMAAMIRAELTLGAFRESLDKRGEGAGPGIKLTRAFFDSQARAGAPASRGGVDPIPENAGGVTALAPADYPTLAQYGSDLTRLAAEGKLRPLIGRRGDLRKVVKVLLRLQKSNPLIHGEAGVGKTALVEGLAQAIVAGELPSLSGKNLVRLDLNALVAGTSSRGEFEKRMKGVIDEARRSEGRVILFIDEIHKLVGAGSAEGAQDAANILKEALSDGSLSIIGATTSEELRRIEKNGALERRFQPVKLEAPTPEEAVAVLEGLKPIYEERHGVSIALETVKKAVELASRYVKSRQLPDSALDLMDDAAAEVELKAAEAAEAGRAPRLEVLPEDLAAEVESRTGIPAGDADADDRAKLKDLPDQLKSRVVGQDEAVEAVAAGVKRGRAGLRDPKQPIASYLFMGPTGVGKTELARATALKVFGS